jgi:propionyl-CoA carboxylase alpha chain
MNTIESKIQKVLVANRGEIAVRIIRTLRKLGVGSVVVYHAADAGSLAVREADEAVELMGDPPVAAYLDVAQIVGACQATGADAVHPGYGFLSEKADFADALMAAGVRFLGPPADAIRRMGDKIESKLLAQKAGVSVIPGYIEEVRDADHAAQIGAAIGYPIMIKASAGGGGKGMRLANNEAECRAGFGRATSEAATSFGDGRVFIERFIERPRHIEIQVLGDQHGHVIFLGERECSIQRRHQKVIEEAPSYFLDEATRTAMGAQAVVLAKTVNYCSAGTVEFIVDPNRNFYFLEMNTRLQVEHPVTELITGLDIVAEQISIAEGKPLHYRQEDICPRGHAIEVRLCAEDADNGYLPMTGDIHLLRWPHGDGIRVDHGLIEGQGVSSFFDSMLAKIIAYGATRAEAIARLRAALRETAVLGTVTNAAFLERVLAHPKFAAGDIHTGFLDEHRQALEPAAPDAHERAVLLVAAAMTSRQFDVRFSSTRPMSLIGSWSN